MLGGRECPVRLFLQLDKIFAQVCTDFPATSICTKFAHQTFLHTFCTGFSAHYLLPKNTHKTLENIAFLRILKGNEYTT
jgi:hypothetical protein